MTEQIKSTKGQSVKEWKESMLEYSKEQLIDALHLCNKAHDNKLTAIQRLNKYRDMYDINIQMWDEVNIYVNRKDAQTYDTSEITSIGGYEDFDQAVMEIVKILDRMNA